MTTETLTRHIRKLTNAVARKGGALIPALVLAALGIAAEPALAQGCLESTASWSSGPSAAILVQDGMAFYGVGATLVIADLSSAGRAVTRGSAQVGGAVRAVAVDGRCADVATRAAGLRVVGF